MEEIVLRNGTDKMDFYKVTKMLTNSYWSPGIEVDEVKKGANNSALVIGAFLLEGQVGYARVVSDKMRYAHILDLYVESSYRKRGIGKRILEYILSHEELKNVDMWFVLTNDAHGIYRKVGFKSIPVSLASFMLVIDKKNQSLNYMDGSNKYLS